MVTGLSGVQFVYSRVWLQTELDDTKSCCQFIITVTIFEKINAFFFGERAFNTNVQNEKKYDRQRQFGRVSVVVAMVIVTTSVIGGFNWMHLTWLANVTVPLQVSDYNLHND